MNRYLYPTFKRPSKFKVEIGDRVSFPNGFPNAWIGKVIDIEGDCMAVEWEDNTVSGFVIGEVEKI